VLIWGSEATGGHCRRSRVAGAAGARGSARLWVGPGQQATIGSSTGPRGDARLVGRLGNQAGMGAQRRRQ
jgi:hypothetical protein